MVPHVTTTPLLPPAPGSSSGALTKRVTLESLGAGNVRSEQRSTSGERGNLPSRLQHPSPTKHEGLESCLLCPWSPNLGGEAAGEVANLEFTAQIASPLAMYSQRSLQNTDLGI